MPEISSSAFSGGPVRNSPAYPSLLDKKEQYLITDDGFGVKLAHNLLAFALAATVVVIVPALHDAAIDLYGRTNEFMMTTSHRMAWWSLLGLLSSSCCALQIILNTLSFGCAGFNTVLGPMRPTFVALTIAAQAAAWAVAYPRPWQWAPAAASSALSAVLTLLPEAVAAMTSRREQRRRDTQQTALGGGVKVTKLRFKLEMMGCASCVSTVSRVLDRMVGVKAHTVKLEDGIAEIEVPNSHVNNRAREEHEELTVREDVVRKLTEAGFPASYVGSSEVTVDLSDCPNLARMEK